MKHKILVEVVSTQGCSKCEKTKQTIAKVLHGKNIDYKEIDLIDNPDIAIKHGIMATPAIIINGKLEFEGTIRKEELRKRLEGHLNGI